MVDSRPIKSTVSRARVVYWHYVVQNFGASTGIDYRTLLGGGAPTSDADIFKTERGIIEEEITEVQVSKSIDNPSGSFRITMLASKNWKMLLSPGDWVAIYMSSAYDNFDYDSPDSKNMVMFGSIDRVTKTKQRDEETDKVLVRYIVTGRDFGRVFEDTDIWFNPHTNPTALIDLTLTVAGMKFTGSPSEMMDSILDTFFGKAGGGAPVLGTIPVKTTFGLGKAEVELKQGYIPEEVALPFSAAGSLSPPKFELGGTGAVKSVPINSLIEREFYIQSGLLYRPWSSKINLPGYKSRAMLSASNSPGNIWGLMKRESNALVNDLYCELIKDEDGNCKPTVILAPHPNSNFFEDTPGELNDAFYKLGDLEQIEVGSSQIKYEDLGRDGNSKVNMVWLTSRESTSATTNKIAYLGKETVDGIGLPMFQSESIKRYGLKIYDQMLEFCFSNALGKVDATAGGLYRSFINQIYDLHVYNHLYETGSVVSTGNNKARIGGTLRIKDESQVDSKFNPTDLLNKIESGDTSQDRLYYIEGYSHNWKFPDQWETEWQLTHGQFDSESAPFIDLREEDAGQADNESNRRYLVKTNVPRSESGVLLADVSSVSDYKYKV